ncbi:ATP-binding protein [Herbaspirillum huttiense]|jgi:two-component system sensor histidine kinase UhpB|uniref:Oxygen sensor histidine kinase NreB n=4 Tax=Pseudomonadota TaxID=1224 RepID=A0AAJ2HAY5_9BURK|nr:MULTISPECIES: ATP-binding protein [Herbaspirillum]MAF03325.1 histidine kinase [Herbaspirillum sp.]MBN9358140.1 response regulator [Herbaspirillum huttiense]MBO17406.1 histidine kinase [Herbaspirillum sp.]MBP1313687.1 two-component system sensor histidine kinase UhpB [Herbaspirillum sp. 1130]MCO4856270.1 response regulator [Herbaspirillum sp. WGmk3]
MSIPLRVLFVEDMEEDAVLMVRELKRGGFDPTWERVDDEQALLAALQAQRWDIVISDYSMPMFSGVEALKLVKADNDQTPFIIVSGVIGEQTAVEVMKAGAQDYFLKSAIARLPHAVDRELRDAQARRKQRASAQALREMQARFNAFMNAAPMPTWIKDAQLRYSYVNPAQSAFYGMTPHDMDGMTDAELMTTGGAEASREYDRKVLEEKCELHTQETVFDHNHNARILDVVRFPISGEGKGDMVAGLAIDVTEREQSRRELELAIQRQQLLSSRVIEVQERERQHLARGLHDDVGQSLTALKINLETIKKTGSLEGPSLQNGIDIVTAVLAQVRSLSLDLRPPQLDNLGLIAALRSYVEQKSKLANVNGWFESSGHDEELHHDIENTAFRIVQEAVTNILRHAKCQNIWVKIDRQQDQVYLSIRDDGKGFDIERARSNAISGTSFGLLNMEERAVLVGGSMDITSAPGAGTEIVMHLPVAPIVRRM